VQRKNLFCRKHGEGAMFSKIVDIHLKINTHCAFWDLKIAAADRKDVLAAAL
jgi:hypothetical protein